MTLLPYSPDELSKLRQALDKQACAVALAQSDGWEVELIIVGLMTACYEQWAGQFLRVVWR